ncbi:MAG: hypothetical protein DMF74_04380 [Acidobacteria bacterium]|nr:MAG: hypothetical protein DMF74_04380 [Acidobacteriota bacterium]
MAWHLVTCEYPPQAGGVSDYTQLVAKGLALAGDEVHVWCPQLKGGTETEINDQTDVFVHRELGSFSVADLRRVSGLLDRFDSPRRLLVQWVPHGYGYNSMNFQFCLWLWKRAARTRDRIDLMVHEPCLPFGKGSIKQNGVAAVHRLMTIVLLNAARHVWMSIPAWAARLRPYSLGRALPFSWLPVPSSIPIVHDPLGVRVVRQRYAPGEQQIVGHFGTCDRNISKLLLQSIPTLLHSMADCVALFLGHGSETVRDELIHRYPDLADRVHATGSLTAADLSPHISACDVMLQPYIDGVSSRRTSVMASLSHGLPIVTAKGALTESIWTESHAVALVAADDVEALIQTTKSLLANASVRSELGKAARGLYETRFALSHVVEALRNGGPQTS